MKDPLNLSNPSPAASPSTVAAEIQAAANSNSKRVGVPKIKDITDPLNLNVDIAATSGDDSIAAELISPSGRPNQSMLCQKLFKFSYFHEV